MRREAVRPVVFTGETFSGNGHCIKAGNCQHCPSNAVRLHKHKQADGSYVWLCRLCHPRAVDRKHYKDHPDTYKRKRTSIPDRFSRARSAAKRRGKTWELTVDQYKLLISKPCFYGKDHPCATTGSGLDRLNNKIGYTIINVVPCCGLHNTQKGLLEMIGFQFPRTVELMTELTQKEIK